jgi:hypothetical protein
MRKREKQKRPHWPNLPVARLHTVMALPTALHWWPACTAPPVPQPHRARPTGAGNARPGTLLTRGARSGAGPQLVAPQRSSKRRQLQHVLESSVQHLHRVRRGRWLGAGVSEINLRNPALNHATWGSLHNLFHITIWTSGTRTTTGKMWTVQVSRLKTGVRSSSRKTMPMREAITTMRTWAISKAFRHKVVLLWTKTIWAMVRLMREMRQSMRRSVIYNVCTIIWLTCMSYLPRSNKLCNFKEG